MDSLRHVRGAARGVHAARARDAREELRRWRAHTGRKAPRTLHTRPITDLGKSVALVEFPSELEEEFDVHLKDGVLGTNP